MKLFENEILYLLGNRVITILCIPYRYCSNCIFREGILCKLRYFQVNNPNKFLKSEDVISDPKDLELYKKALKDRQRFFPNSTIEDVKGTGSQPYEIGFRTVTMP